MRWLLICGLGMLGACGGGAPTPAEPSPTAAAATTNTASIDPAHLDCDARPDFVVLRPDAQLENCSAGKGPSPQRESGTIIYLTGDPAIEVVNWYREQAKTFGMQDALRVDAPNPMYSAKQGDARNFMVLTEAANGKTRVILNWGRDA